MIDNHALAWRRSSYSGGGSASGGNCVETATLPDGRIAVRDSKNPTTTVSFDHAAATAWLENVKTTHLH
jgi:Domain of unknown function (DUF397)